MKTIQVIAVFYLALGVLGCSKNKLSDVSAQQVENSYPTADAAFNAAKNNLHSILNDMQKRSYGLESDEQIKNLTTTNDIPLILLSMNQLKDTVVNTAAEAKLYAIGQAGSPKICITVKKAKDTWMISTIGLKKYVDALASNTDVTGIVEALGLELSFLELQTANGKAYKPLTDYREAKLSSQATYSATQMLGSLENYRAALETKFGKEFSAGELDR